MEPVFDIIQLMRQEEPPGFTPVRRRDQPQYNASPALLTSAPWTTSRCNRLLRPLSSRITLLRRHREQKESKSRYTQVVAPGIDSKTRGKTEDVPCDAPQIFPPQPNKRDDPEWTPDHEPRKKLKRTYSSKGGSQKGTQPELGGQAIPSRRTQFRIQVPVVDPQFSQGCGFLAPGQSSGAGARFRRSVSVTGRDNVSVEVTRPRAQPKPALTRESFRRLAKSVSPDEWMLDSGIYSGLDALLKATTKHTPQPATGARSLFASCLRQVPEYIAEEQRWPDEKDEDEGTDISSTTYMELESLGSGESGGWKPLREIVRAHGVAIIGNAIRDGTIWPGTARGLTILCLQASAHDEADSLLDSSLSTLQRLAKPVRLTDDLFETSVYMRTLRDTTNYDRWRFLHRSLNWLLLNGVVPVEWMSCQCMINFWNHATRAITRQDESAAEAADLIRTVVALSYQTAVTLSADQVHVHRLLSPADRVALPSQKPMSAGTLGSGCVDNSAELKTHNEAKMGAEFTGTISRLLAILTSIRIMHSEEEGAVAVNRHKFMQELLLTLAVDAHHLDATAPDSAHITQICLPLLAYVLMSSERVEDSVHDQFCITFFRRIARLESKSTEIGTLASFLCAIAHCCEKNGGKTGFEYMQSIVQKLLQFSQHPACTRLALRRINSLLKEAAFDFAEQTARQEHLDWALEVEETIEVESTADSQQPTVTPARTTHKKGTGFRWEDGICEWVAKTPAPFAVVIPSPQDNSSGSSGSSDEGDKTDVSTLPSEVEDCSVLSQPRRPRGRPPGTTRSGGGDDISAGPSEPDDSSLLSPPRRPRGRPPGRKRARSSISCVAEPAARPFACAKRNNSPKAAEEVYVHKPGRGRPPRARACLADVTNCSRVTRGPGECDGGIPKKRRMVGRTRKNGGVGVIVGRGDCSEDELGM